MSNANITVTNSGNATVTITSSGVELTVEQGQPGVGVPAGGLTGQVLAKFSNADYDMSWQTGSGSVTSVTGTANEVTVSPTTGAVVVGLPDDVTVRDLNAEHLKFDTTPTVTTAAQADMVWTDNQSTVSVGMSSTVSAALGQTVYKRGKNTSGAPIAKGKIVYITGGTGSADLTFGLATNATEAGSSAAIGFAAETIADNSHGFVICTGLLTGIDTSAFPMNEGQAMYLGTAGGVLSSLPTQPLHGVFCGWLVKKGAGSSGVLYAKFDNYQELEELSDVLIGTAGGGIALADKNILQYDGTSGVWRNKSLDGDKGDITVSNSGATWTIDALAVTEAKIADGAVTEDKLGPFSVGAGSLATGAVTTSKIGDFQVTFVKLASNSVTTAKLENSSVTYPKIQNVTTGNRLLGRANGAGAGVVQEITPTGLLEMGGTGGDELNLADGTKGDIVVSRATSTLTVGNGAVTFAKMQAVSANVLLGNDATGTTVQEITCTAAGRALLDDADSTEQRTTLGLGTLATQSGTFSGTSSGTNTGDQTITLTGDVTGSGTGSFAATIANDSVTYAKMQDVSATNRLLGRQSAGAGDVEEITCTAAGRAILDDADASAQRTTLGLAAGGAGDIWVEKSGDTMTGTLTSTIGSVTSARSITATGTSTATSSFPILASWTHTLAPTANSTAVAACFQFENVFDSLTGITYGTVFGFSANGLRWGANADGAVTTVRGANITGAYVNPASVATIGTLTNATGIFVTGLTRQSGTSAGTVTNALAVDATPVGSGAFAVNSAIGLRVNNAGTGNTITHLIGLDIVGQTQGATSNIGVRIAAASGGTTNAALQLSGTTGAASGILFSTDVNLYRSAANVLKTDDTFEALNVSGTNTGDQLTYARFTPVDNAPPAANAATSGLRNRIPILEFDDATNETAYFIGIMPQGAKLASGLKVRIHWTAATATSGNCYWAVAFERLNTDIDADSFGADTLAVTTTNGTSGVPNVTEITVTTIDGITAGDAFRLRIVRQASDVLDTMTGDAQIIAVEIRSAV